MAGGFGNALLNLMGAADPKRQLLQATLGTLGGQPLGGDGTGTGATPPAATGAPGQPAVATAYTSPPELLQLYDSLLSRAQKERRIDQGIGLIASSFAQPDNRPNIMAATQGSYDDAGDVFGAITDLQKYQYEQQQAAAEKQKAAEDRARQLAMLPAIGKQYGWDENTVRALFDAGELDNAIEERLKGTGKEVVKLADGSTVLVDKSNGGQSSLAPAYESTDDTIEYDRYVKQERAAGRTPMDLQSWMLTMKKAAAASTTVNNNMGGNSGVKAAGEAIANDMTSRWTAGREQVKSLTNFDSALAQLDKGIVSGSIASTPELMGRKVLADMFGVPDSEIANTETFQAQMKANVLPLVKQLGTGNSISNADREFVEKAIGGDITLDEKSARRIITILQRGIREDNRKLNEDITKFRDASNDDFIKQTLNNIDLPGYSDTYLNTVVNDARVPQTALEFLGKNADDQSVLKDFSDMYNIPMQEVIVLAEKAKATNGQ